MDIENEEEVVEETVEETQEESTEQESEGTEESTETKKPYESLEARKSRLERQLAQTNKKLGVDVEPKEHKTSKKSDDLDYGQKAYLTANGVKGAKEFEFVKNELKASGQDLDSLLENDYFQNRLEKFRTLNKTSEAIPKGTRSGGVATDSVEYWASKPIEEVPQEMRIKVVKHKLAKTESKGVFYNS